MEIYAATEEVTSESMSLKCIDFMTLHRVANRIKDAKEKRIHRSTINFGDVKPKIIFGLLHIQFAIVLKFRLLSNS